LWFEDVDFCKRTRDSGLKIQYVPQVIARHQGGNSIAKLDWEGRQAYWYANLLRYACKHFRPRAYRGLSAAVVLGSILRAVLEVIRSRSTKPLRVYATIAKMAALGVISGHVGEPKMGVDSKAIG